VFSFHNISQVIGWEGWLFQCPSVHQVSWVFWFERNLLCGKSSMNDNDCMPSVPIQGQGQGTLDLKCAKMAKFKGYLLCQYACNQKTNGELWYSKAIFKFQLENFWYSFSFDITWPSNLGCSTFGRRILPLTRSQPAVPYGQWLNSARTGWNGVPPPVSGVPPPEIAVPPPKVVVPPPSNDVPSPFGRKSLKLLPPEVRF